MLLRHAASAGHVTLAAYSCERGGRITQLQYLLQLSLRTSENSVQAKFTGIAHLPHRPGPIGPTLGGDIIHPRGIIGLLCTHKRTSS
jgi:hypothetical protein